MFQKWWATTSQMRSLGSLGTHLSGAASYPWLLKSVPGPRIENTFHVFWIYVSTTSPFLLLVCQTTIVVILGYNVLNYRASQNWIISVLVNGFYIACQIGQTIHVLFRWNLFFFFFFLWSSFSATFKVDNWPKGHLLWTRVHLRSIMLYCCYVTCLYSKEVILG